MLFRAIALSLALLVGIGTIIPIVTDTTEAGPKYKKKKKKKFKKYSKAWWKWYKKQQRKKRALLARKRALRAKQILLARQRMVKKTTSEVKPISKMDKKGNVREKVVAVVAQDNTPPTLPSGKKAPKSFKQTQATSSELDFQVSDDNGNRLGRASLTVLRASQGEDSDSGRNKSVGGVSINELRREVINRMMREDGWVVNDYQKTINGKKVYVVIAQSPLRGVIQSRQFYFTEVDGKIYTLATTSSNDVQEIIARESEKVIQSLQRGNRPTQALNK